MNHDTTIEFHAPGIPARRLPVLSLLLPALFLTLGASPCIGGTARGAGLKAKGVSCTVKSFLGRTDFPLGSWIPLVVEVRNDGAEAAAVRAGVAPFQAGPEAGLRAAVVTTRLQVEPGTAKKVFLYVPPWVCASANVFWEVDGAAPGPPDILDLQESNESERILLVAKRADARRRLQAVLGGEAVVLTSGPDELPDRPEGFDAFHTVILHDPDLELLPHPVKTALRDWTVRGGVLVLSPGEKAGVFRDEVFREIHSFRALEAADRRVIRAFGAREASAPPVEQVVHRIRGGDPLLEDGKGVALALQARAGLGSVIALAAGVEAVEALTPGGVIWFLQMVLRVPPKLLPVFIAPLPLEAAGAIGEGDGIPETLQAAETGTGVLVRDATNSWPAADAPAVRTRSPAILADDGVASAFGFQPYPEPVETWDLVPALVSEIVGAPGIGFVAFILLAFVAAAGPLNYVLLKKRGAPAWSAVTVPFISVVFVLLIVIAGLLTRGGARGNRLTVLEARPGSSWGVATEFDYFRSGAGGEYGFEVEADGFPVPPPGVERRFQLDESGRDLLNLPLERWTVSSFQSERALDLQGTLRVEWKDGAVEIENRLPFEIGGGLLLPPSGWTPPKTALGARIESGGVFARGIRVPTGMERTVGFDPMAWEDLAEDEKILFALLERMNYGLARGGLACWAERPFDAPRLDGAVLVLEGDRTALLMPLDGIPARMMSARWLENATGETRRLRRPAGRTRSPVARGNR